MPRIAWRHLVIVLLALPLASCIGDETSKCATCPRENSGRIDILVTQTGLVDSVHIAMDGGASVTVRRGRRGIFGNLSRGTHSISTVRYFSSEGVAFPRSTDLQIKLEQGETRVIVFHNDFPLVTWSPFPAGRGGRSGPDAIAAHPVG